MLAFVAGLVVGGAMVGAWWYRRAALVGEGFRLEADTAKKRAYDDGWDARELLERRKRQAAGQLAAKTRAKGAR